jgi:hypothetical protein
MFYWALVTFIIFPLIYIILNELIKLYTSGEYDAFPYRLIDFIGTLPSAIKRRKGDGNNGSDKQDIS